MAVVYRHVRLDKNEVFYIGIGQEYKRAYSLRNRNKYWRNIISKSDYKVEILFEDLTWSEACNKEKELIKLYGRKDLGKGSLVNVTDGGDGILGFRHSIETRARMGRPGNLNQSFGNGWRVSGEKNGRFGTGHLYRGVNNSNAKKVAQIDLITDKVIKVWDYKKLAADTLNISSVGISAVCHGRQIKAGGYKWKYIN